MALDGTATTEERPPLSVLLVQIEHEIYAIASDRVRAVSRYRPITPVPGAPRTLPGILSEHGTILPVADTRLILDLGLAEVTRATRLVVVAVEEHELALLVDAVLDLAQLPAEAVEPVPAALDPARARFLTGVVQQDGQPIALLDLAELVESLRDWS
jgi:purine-binding chemotaxis protein CheW